MSAATLSGRTIIACRITMSAWGVWWADVETDDPAELAGSVTISISGLELVGTIVTGGTRHGRSRYRIAAGAGRWGVAVTQQGYRSDLGVKLATVLNEVATAVGETLDASTISGTIGPAWTREAGPASRQLALLAERAWHVGIDGVTRLGVWPSTTYTGAATVEKRDEAHQRMDLAPDTLAGLVPNATVEGEVAADVVHTLVEGEAVRTSVWWAHDGTVRRGDIFGALVARALVSLRYQGMWSYRVVAQTGERLDLQIERTSSGMPDQLLVRVRAGSPGVKAEWTPGSLCLVTFVDGSPSRPVVVGADDPDSEGFVPAELLFGAPPYLGVGRQTDPIAAGPFAGTITLGSLTVKAGT